MKERHHTVSLLQEAVPMFVAVLVFLVLVAVLAPLVGVDSREHDLRAADYAGSYDPSALRLR